MKLGIRAIFCTICLITGFRHGIFRDIMKWSAKVIFQGNMKYGKAIRYGAPECINGSWNSKIMMYRMYYVPKEKNCTVIYTRNNLSDFRCEHNKKGGANVTPSFRTVKLCSTITQTILHGTTYEGLVLGCINTNEQQFRMKGNTRLGASSLRTFFCFLFPQPFTPFVRFSWLFFVSSYFLRFQNK